MQVTVEVTAADIEHGVRHNCESCPVAKGIRRVLRGDYYAMVDEEYICVRHEETRTDSVSLKTPRNAAEFINDFDAVKSVEPFSFPLDIPKQYLRERSL